MNKLEDINSYLKELQQYSSLSNQEIISLLKIGDANSKEKVITANLLLVVKIAYKYANNENKLNDLIQEGNIGLIDAVNHFDNTKSENFSSYATYWIKKRIFEYINKSKMIVIPENINILLKKVEDLKSQGYDNQQIAKLLNLSYQRIIEVLSYKYDRVELISQELENKQNDYLLKELLNDLLDKLDDEADKNIIRKYLGLNNYEEHSFKEIGEEMGISKTAVYKRYCKAVKRLREYYDQQEN